MLFRGTAGRQAVCRMYVFLLVRTSPKENLNFAGSYFRSLRQKSKSRLITEGFPSKLAKISTFIPGVHITTYLNIWVHTHIYICVFFSKTIADESYMILYHICPPP